MTERFAWRGLVARLLFSLLVVFATYNPSGRSYWHWLWQGEAGIGPKLTAGLVLLIAHLMIITTLFGALGRRGVLLVGATLLAGAVTLMRLVGVDTLGGAGIVLLPLILLSALYAAGLSWSHLHHRLAGVVHVEKLK